MAREKLSEKCTRIALKYLPKDYTFQYRRSLTGRCCRSQKWIKAPKPVTRRALFIWLHECHHDQQAYSKFPNYYAEYQCEMFAMGTMKAEGVEVHPQSIEGAKAYVKQRLTQGGTFWACSTQHQTRDRRVVWLFSNPGGGRAHALISRAFL